MAAAATSFFVEPSSGLTEFWSERMEKACGESRYPFVVANVSGF